MQNKVLCICGNEPINSIKWGQTQSNIKCEICNFYQHIDCISPSNNETPYICPFCQFTLFDPFIRIKYHFFIPQIIQHSLSTKNIFLKFNLDDNIFNMFLHEENDMLLLRCLKINEEGFCIEWPNKINIYINNHEKEIYSVDKANDTFKRQINEEIPFKLNKNLKCKNPFNEKMRYAFDYLKLNEENIINIKFNSTEKSSDKYIITLDYINMIDDVNEIIKDIKIIKDINELKKLIKTNEILLEEILFIDPISKSDIIIIPSRGWKCNHLECFDLKVFLEMQKKTRRFCCPICNKKVGQIYIDGLMKDIIEKYNENYEGIQINGNYEIVKLIEKSKTNNNKKDKNEIKNYDLSINSNDSEEHDDDDEYEDDIDEDDSYSEDLNEKYRNRFKFKSTNESSNFSYFKHHNYYGN